MLLSYHETVWSLVLGVGCWVLVLGLVLVLVLVVLVVVVIMVVVGALLFALMVVLIVMKGLWIASSIGAKVGITLL